MLRQPIRIIILTVDASDTSVRAAKYAIKLATALNAYVIAIHVVAVPLFIPE
ncbi:MAG: universal stress protein [Nitrososphaerales archaeon]